MSEQAQESVLWPYPHPAFGTCVSSCPRYRKCHCGCSKRPRRAGVTFASRQQPAGEPYVFAQGHHVRVHHPRGGPYSRKGIDIENVRPLLFWLREQHGSMRAVAEVLRTPEATIRGYACKQQLQRVPPEAAGAIQRAVLSVRARPLAWNEWE